MKEEVGRKRVRGDSYIDRQREKYGDRKLMNMCKKEESVRSIYLIATIIKYIL